MYSSTISNNNGYFHRLLVSVLVDFMLMFVTHSLYINACTPNKTTLH